MNLGHDRANRVAEERAKVNADVAEFDELGAKPIGGVMIVVQMQFDLTKPRAARLKPGCLVMHPGPINRGVEIDSAVVDGKQSVILPQVTYGIAVRMAVMSIVAGNEA